MNFFSDGKLINRQSNETETEPFTSHRVVNSIAVGGDGLRI